MTPKELQYIEDALSHLKFLKSQCNDAVQNLSDPVLRQQAQQFVNRNQQIFAEFYGLI